MSLQTALALILTIGILYGLWFLVGKSLVEQAIENIKLIRERNKK